MNEISVSVNSEWLSVKQGAEYFQITTVSFLKLIKKYLSSLANHVEQISSSGRGGKSYRITKEGLVILANIKNDDRGNQNKSFQSPSERKIEAKKNIAETAIAAIQLPTELLNDPFIQLRLKQLQQDQKLNQHDSRIDNIEHKQQEAEKQLLALPEAKTAVIEISSRAKLNKIVYLYATATGIQPETAWQVIYDHIYYCHHKNIKSRALSAGVKCLDIIEQEGLCEPSYSFLKSKLDKIHA